MDIKPGQKLYSEIATRANNLIEIKEYEVENVGRKYIWLKNYHEYPINRKTLIYTDKVYSQNSFQLYTEAEQIHQLRRKNNLFGVIRHNLMYKQNMMSIPLEDLEKIADILKIKVEP